MGLTKSYGFSRMLAIEALWDVWEKEFFLSASLGF
jgi:hypothetical protein